MKPYIHAELSVRKYGGKVQDYIPIHDFFDQTKAHHADMRHRMILHNAWGIFMCEKQFGTFIINSDGNPVQVRDLGEDHVLQDLGRIPSLSECIQQVPVQNMGYFARPNETKKSSLDEMLKAIKKSPEANRVLDGASKHRFDLEPPKEEPVVIETPDDDTVFFDGGKPNFDLEFPTLELEPATEQPISGEIGMPEIAVDDSGYTPEEMVADGSQNALPGRFDRGPAGDIVLD